MFNDKQFIVLLFCEELVKVIKSVNYDFVCCCKNGFIEC